MEKQKLDLLKNIIGDDVQIIDSLKGGMMNEAYIVQSIQGKFVYYISTEQANEMVDRNLEKETHSIAYSLGLTSENIYFDLKKGIKINRYFEGESLNNINEFDYKEVAKLLAKYHASKVKASKYYAPLKRLEEYKKEAETFVNKFDDEFYSLFELIQNNSDFLLSQPLHLSHNDAQRSNIIKTTNNEYKLIDFEFAANNDEVYDISTFGNGDVNEGKKLLEEYEKIVPLKDGLKRYVLWRIDISLQWYLVAIIKHYRGEGALHGFDFLAVAAHFLDNAIKAKELLK